MAPRPKRKADDHRKKLERIKKSRIEKTYRENVRKIFEDLYELLWGDPEETPPSNKDILERALNNLKLCSAEKAEAEEKFLARETELKWKIQRLTALARKAERCAEGGEDSSQFEVSLDSRGTQTDFKELCSVCCDELGKPLSTSAFTVKASMKDGKPCLVVVPDKKEAKNFSKKRRKDVQPSTPVSASVAFSAAPPQIISMASSNGPLLVPKGPNGEIPIPRIMSQQSLLPVAPYPNFIFPQIISLIPAAVTGSVSLSGSETANVKQPVTVMKPAEEKAEDPKEPDPSTDDKTAEIESQREIESQLVDAADLEDLGAGILTPDPKPDADISTIEKSDAAKASISTSENVDTSLINPTPTVQTNETSVSLPTAEDWVEKSLLSHSAEKIMAPSTSGPVPTSDVTLLQPPPASVAVSVSNPMTTHFPQTSLSANVSLATTTDPCYSLSVQDFPLSDFVTSQSNFLPNISNCVEDSKTSETREKTNPKHALSDTDHSISSKIQQSCQETPATSTGSLSWLQNCWMNTSLDSPLDTWPAAKESCVPQAKSRNKPDPRSHDKRRQSGIKEPQLEAKDSLPLQPEKRTAKMEQKASSAAFLSVSQLVDKTPQDASLNEHTYAPSTVKVSAPRTVAMLSHQPQASSSSLQRSAYSAEALLRDQPSYYPDTYWNRGASKPSVAPQTSTYRGTKYQNNYAPSNQQQRSVVPQQTQRNTQNCSNPMPGSVNQHWAPWQSPNSQSTTSCGSSYQVGSVPQTVTTSSTSFSTFPSLSDSWNNRLDQTSTGFGANCYAQASSGSAVSGGCNTGNSLTGAELPLGHCWSNGTSTQIPRYAAFDQNMSTGYQTQMTFSSYSQPVTQYSSSSSTSTAPSYHIESSKYRQPADTTSSASRSSTKSSTSASRKPKQNSVPPASSTSLPSLFDQGNIVNQGTGFYGDGKSKATPPTYAQLMPSSSDRRQGVQQPAARDDNLQQAGHGKSGHTSNNLLNFSLNALFPDIDQKETQSKTANAGSASVPFQAAVSQAPSFLDYHRAPNLTSFSHSTNATASLPSTGQMSAFPAAGTASQQLHVPFSPLITSNSTTTDQTSFNTLGFPSGAGLGQIMQNLNF